MYNEFSPDLNGMSLGNTYMNLFLRAPSTRMKSLSVIPRKGNQIFLVTEVHDMYHTLAPMESADDLYASFVFFSVFKKISLNLHPGLRSTDLSANKSLMRPERLPPTALQREKKDFILRRTLFLLDPHMSPPLCRWSQIMHAT